MLKACVDERDAEGISLDCRDRHLPLEHQLHRCVRRAAIGSRVCCSETWLLCLQATLARGTIQPANNPTVRVQTASRMTQGRKVLLKHKKLYSIGESNLAHQLRAVQEAGWE